MSQPISLVYLARAAEHSNTAFYVWSEFQGVTVEGAADANAPWYELRAQSDPPGADFPTTIDTFCDYIVHDLTTRGKLDRAEGIRLLTEMGY